MTGSPQSIDVAAVVDNRRLGAFNFKLILLSWLITVFDGFDMMMISFTAPYMRDELGLDTVQLGYVFSAGTAGMVVGGFLFSYLADRIGRRPTVIFTAYAFGLLTLATGFAQNYEQLLALRFLDGLAIGGMLPVAWALNIEFVPAGMRATVVTVIMLGFTIGSTMAGPVTVWVAPSYGWEGVFILGGSATIVCAALLWFGLPESVRFLTSRNRRPDLVAATLNRLAPGLNATAETRFELGDERKASFNFRVSQLFEGRLRWLTPLLWTGYIVSSLAVFFKSSWGPIVYEEMQFARDTAAYASSVGGLLGAVGGLLLMRFTDKHGPFAVAVYPTLALPFLLVLGLAPMSPGLFIPLSIFGSALVSAAHFGVVSIAGMFYPSAIRANGAGWTTSIAKIGGVMGPIIGAAVLASNVPAIRTFALLAICPAILATCAVGIGTIVRRRPQVAPAIVDAVPAS